MSACVDARLLHYVPMLLFDLFRAMSACSTSGRGFRSRGLFGCCRFNQIWMLFLLCRCFRTGVSILGSRLGGQPVLRSLCALQVAVALF